MNACKCKPYIVDIIIFRLVYFIAEIWWKKISRCIILVMKLPSNSLSYVRYKLFWVINFQLLLHRLPYRMLRASANR